MPDEGAGQVCDEQSSNEEKLEDLKNKIKKGDDDLDKHVKDYIDLYLDIDGHPEKNFEGSEDISNLAEVISDSLDNSVPANIIRQHLEAKIKMWENSCIDPSEKSIHEVDDPIMMFNGQFVHESIDLKIIGAGMDFVFKRFYKNQANYDGPLGYNWDHNYNLWLRISNQTIFRSTGEHREDIYKKHPIYDYWMPPNGQHSIIVKVGQLYECQMPNGIKYVYTQHPNYPFIYLISKIVDKFDNYIEFHYNPDWKLEFIKINNDHRYVKFIYDEQGRIVNLIDYTKEFNPLGRRWIYIYDYFGDLVSVTTTPTDRYTEGLTTIYEYSSSSYTDILQHNLTRIIDPVGQIYLENEYGAELGYLSFNRIIRQRQGSGESYFSYDNIIEEFEFEYSDIERPAYQTNFIDTNGHPIHYIYNKYGNLLLKEEYIFQDGVNKLLRWRYRYNLDGEVIGVLTPEGTLNQFFYGRDYYMRKFLPIFEFEIDYNHLTIEERLKFGNRLVIVRRGISYNIEMMDLSKGVWCNFIFPDIISVKNRADIIQKYSYEDEYQQLLSSSDPRYTISPNPDDETAPAEHTRYQETLINYKYNSVTGALESIIYPDTHLPDGSVLNSIESKFPDYDKNGRLLKSIDPEGIITKYEYFDSSYIIKDGYLKRKIIDLGGLNLTTEYEVNEVGIPTMITIPNAFLAVPKPIGYFRDLFSINALDQTIQIINSKPYEYKTKLFYDRNNQLEKEERELRDEAGSIILDGWEVKVYKYDEQLNLTEKTIGGLNLSEHLKTKYIYSHSGKLSKTVFPKGNEILYEYDERHLQTRIIRGNNSPDSAKVRTHYNGNGLRIEIVDGLDNITHYNYDEFNRTKEIIDAEGNIERIDYDKANNVICRRLFELKPDGSYTLLSRVEFTYDELNRMIFESKNLFQVPLSATNLDTDFLASPGPGTTIKTQFFYDKKNRLRQTINQNNQITVYNYDKMDRLIQEIEIRNSNIEIFIENTYDNNGNLTRRDTTERVVDPISGNRVEIFSFIYEFDELDRNTKITDNLGNSTSLFYDSRNRLVKTEDPLGNVIRTNFDIFGRKIETILKMTDNGLGGGIWILDKKIISEFDDNGNNTASIDANNNRTEYKYDELDRKEKIIFPDDSYQELTYDANDNIIYLKDNNGLIHNIIYDERNRLKRKSIDRSELRAGVVIEGATFEEYEYDGLNRIKLEENDFALITRFYDSLNRNYRESITFKGAANDGLGSHVIQRKFDNLNYLTEITYPKGRIIKYHLDSLNRIEKIENITKGANYPGSGTFLDKYIILSNEYFGLRKSSIKNANNTSVKFGFDAAGRKIQITHSEGNTEKLRIQYLYDGASNLRYKNEIDAAGTLGNIYRYNSLYWLSKIEDNNHLPDQNISTYAPHTVWKDPAHLNGQVLIDAQLGSLDLNLADLTYSYDINGNREQENDLLTWPSIYHVNNLNQYEKVNAELFTHDFNGNLKTGALKPGKNFIFYYNYNNQLARVHDLTTDKDVAVFSYDSRRRRIFSDIGGDKTHLIFNGQNLIEEYRGGNVLAQYVNEYDLDSVRQMVVGGKEFWYHKDLVYSTRFLSDETDAFVVDYQYNPFGVQLNLTGQYNPFRYMSRRFNEEINSYDFRSRQYSPDLGRFFQKDILSSENQYWFLDNNPLNGIDPLGTSRKTLKKTDDSTSEDLPSIFAGEVPIIFKREKHDVYPQTSYVDTGHWCSDLGSQALASLENLCGLPFNIAANILELPEDALRGLGVSQLDIDTINFWLLVTGITQARTGLQGLKNLRIARRVLKGKNLPKVPSGLEEGRKIEGQLLKGAPKNTIKVTPSSSDVNSAAFKLIVGEEKFTPTGKHIGTIFDSLSLKNLTALEIKSGSSILDSTYQLRLQTYFSLKPPPNISPLGKQLQLTLRTTRPINPSFEDWFKGWGGIIEKLPMIE